MRGLLLQALVTPADIQDRDGGIALLSTLFGLFPFLEKLFADSAYQGPVFHTALASILPNLKTEIVKRSDVAKGFVALPKRWIVYHRTMLPAWGLSGPHSFSVRAASGRILSWGSSGERVNLSQANQSRHRF
jgi:transposase